MKVNLFATCKVFSLVIVKKSSPKNLLADNRLSGVCCPTVGRLLAVCRPTGFLGSSSSQLLICG